MKLSKYRPKSRLFTVVSTTAVIAFLAGLAIAMANDGRGGVIVAVLSIATILLAALYCAYILVVAPMNSFSQTVRSLIETGDYSHKLTQEQCDRGGRLGPEINSLLAVIMARDDTIKLSERRERQVDNWIKQRKLYEIELKEARTAAEDAALTKSQFLASVSHELRTPLHTMLSYARFGQGDVSKSRYDDVTEYFETILDSGDYLLLLLNDLLNLSKLEAGRMNFDLSPCSLGDIVGCILEPLDILVREKRIDVVLDLNEPDLVFIDSSRTMQVVRNLVDNAIKFAPAHSTIYIDVRQSDGTVTLCIRDQGPGVPEEEIDLIFDSFRQSSETRTDTGGVGLGLAISKQLVFWQRGQIWAENHREGGLAVFVQFAACNSDQPIESVAGAVGRESQFDFALKGENNAG